MIYLPQILKRCSRCGEYKPLTREFYVKDRSSPTGFTYECKTCHWPPKPPRYPAGATSRVCRVCGKDTPLDQLKKDNSCPYGRDALCKACHNLQQQEYKSTHRNEIRQRNRAYYRATIEQQRIRRRKNYVEHREELLEYHRQRNQKPHRKRQLNAACHRRRARQLAVGGSYTVADIDAQYKRQKGRCYWCGEKLNKKYEIDHVIPLALGGSNDPSNLVVACRPCNRHKSGKLPHETTNKLL